MRQDLPDGFVQFQLSLLRLVLQVEAEMSRDGEQSSGTKGDAARMASE